MRSLLSVTWIVAISAPTWFCALPNPAQAQSTNVAPKFEITSVRENRSDSTESDLNHRRPDRFTATNVPLGFVILDAYEIKAHQLSGTPDWMWNKSYDIVGTFPALNPDIHQVHLMEQQMLADRFILTLHKEQHEIAAYDLVFAKKDEHLGPQLHRSTMDCAAWVANGRPPLEGATSPISSTGMRPVCSIVATRTWLSAGARTLQDLALSLQAMVGRPVIDKTGLTGPYDIDMLWAKTDLHTDEDAVAAAADAPPIFSAIQEQLGLKLVSHRELFDVFVVDHVQAPSRN
jgi:uncharacterized protein (TIGR03435 family)